MSATLTKSSISQMPRLSATATKLAAARSVAVDAQRLAQDADRLKADVATLRTGRPMNSSMDKPMMSHHVDHHEMMMHERQRNWDMQTQKINTLDHDYDMKAKKIAMLQQEMRADAQIADTLRHERQAVAAIACSPKCTPPVTACPPMLPVCPAPCPPKVECPPPCPPPACPPKVECPPPCAPVCPPPCEPVCPPPCEPVCPAPCDPCAKPGNMMTRNYLWVYILVAIIVLVVIFWYCCSKDCKDKHKKMNCKGMEWANCSSGKVIMGIFLVLAVLLFSWSIACAAGWQRAMCQPMRANFLVLVFVIVMVLLLVAFIQFCRGSYKCAYWCMLVILLIAIVGTILIAYWKCTGPAVAMGIFALWALVVTYCFQRCSCQNKCNKKGNVHESDDGTSVVSSSDQ
jgi:hypothetical protein